MNFDKTKYCLLIYLVWVDMKISQSRAVGTFMRVKPKTIEY